MSAQWKLSGNAETVNWNDIVSTGRAYADNLINEPAVSKIMHEMADEIVRRRIEVVSLRFTKEEQEAIGHAASQLRGTRHARTLLDLLERTK